jgi:glycosyltransferase involved in cell wall biosynthesis
MITVFALAFNEEILAQFMIDHYRSRFPNCHIIIYDNGSTDKTVEIAKANNCEVIDYTHLSGRKLNDILHMKIKNTCWKNAKTDWVLVQDFDELLDITQQQLKNEESLATTLIKSEAWQMVNMEDNYDIKNIKHGYRDADNSPYDKTLLFNKKFIKEVNYSIGAHSCAPIGTIKYNFNPYKLYHYRFINPEAEVIKCQLTAQRLSEENKRYGMGIQRIMSPDQTRADFLGRRGAQKILP